MFVVIEGIDGSGKGSVTKGLADKLQKAAQTVRTVSFPAYDQTLNGKMVGRYLNGEFGKDTSPYFHGLLYALDRFEQKGKLMDAIRSENFLLADRYIPSNLCYSSMKATAETEYAVVNYFVQLEYGVLGMPIPDVIFFLDIPVDLALQNIVKKAERSYTNKPFDLHESNVEFLVKVQDFYRTKLMKFHPSTRFERIECCDGDRLLSIEQLVDILVSKL